MIWQDILISIVTTIFSVALVPQVYYGFKRRTGPIRYYTSVPTFIGLYVIMVVYYTLTLYFAAIVSFFTATLWFLLFLQRVLYSKKRR